ncbi:DUF934 domain-containing protein [Pseudomonas schmalbachii]|uniref:DUF934 domain-containing protein n=1 Tax=Pseudomonas schmalbachii TaxID=2816993 RepID=A0ABS3TNN8_9PSED|nr:DUF934 domain-containing protein [Pseudomonas schmalbachii]MBO3275274.1 DUF934 domain-containing protein [Pseudomonas schmalbachii]
MLLREVGEELPCGQLILPLSAWLLAGDGRRHGVWLAPEDDVEVLRDQLSHMRQCGFDAFAVREDKSVEDALKGLAGLSVLYGRSVIEPRPLFRRRTTG